MRNKPSKQRALMMEAIYSSKTWENTYQTIWYHIPEYSTLQCRRIWKSHSEWIPKEDFKISTERKRAFGKTSETIGYRFVISISGLNRCSTRNDNEDKNWQCSVSLCTTRERNRSTFSGMPFICVQKVMEVLFMFGHEFCSLQFWHLASFMVMQVIILFSLLEI
jgi:hypothetical protein